MVFPHRAIKRKVTTKKPFKLQPLLIGKLTYTNDCLFQFFWSVFIIAMISVLSINFI